MKSLVKNTKPEKDTGPFNSKINKKQTTIYFIPKLSTKLSYSLLMNTFHFLTKA